MARLEDLANSIISGKADAAVEATEGALADGTPAAEILTDGLIAGMQVVGERFKNHEFYVPEVLIAARAMKMSMAKLRPHLVEQDYEPVGTVAIGTVRGDLHDIGKNLVDIILTNNGYRVVNIGIKQPIGAIIEAAKEHKADAIEAFRRASYKFAGRQHIVASKKWGFTQLTRDEYTELRSQDRLQDRGTHVTVKNGHGKFEGNNIVSRWSGTGPKAAAEAE